jgi:uncharacterized membrane protein YeaQ/YmgE (transglycosylase-associated protein family)
MESILNDTVVKSVIQMLYYIFIGLFTSFYFVVILKKKFLGSFLFGALIAVMGATILGAFLNSFVKFLTSFPLGLNSLSTILGAFLLLWFYSKVSEIE